MLLMDRAGMTYLHIQANYNAFSKPKEPNLIGLNTF